MKKKVIFAGIIAALALNVSIVSNNVHNNNSTLNSIITMSKAYGESTIGQYCYNGSIYGSYGFYIDCYGCQLTMGEGVGGDTCN